MNFARALTLTASVAVAASVHFKKRPPLTFTDQGLVLDASGALAGLGNEDVLITLTATADPTTLCTNQGGNEAPGQNPAEVTVTGSKSFSASNRADRAASRTRSASGAGP